MKNTLALAAAAALAAVSLTACGSDDADSAGHNDTDVAFAQGMIPHHAQAVEMSDILLAKDGLDPRVTDLAEEIKAAQQPEIEIMTGWLNEWDAEVPSTDMSEMDGMSSMDGMMSPEELADLEASSGDQASRLFLEQMTVHHDGAIEMAETEVEDGAYPEAVDLAENIIQTQQAEIARMEKLLGEL